MNINYQISGNQRPIVFLHGWGMNMHMMQPHAALLSHDYQCLCLDLFGFGKSDELDQSQNFDDYVDTLHAFLVEKKITSPILLAHSFGARVAIVYASKYPVSALILTGAAGLQKPLSWKKKMRVFFHHHGIPTKGSYDYEKATPFLRKLLVEVLHRNLSEEMKQIQVPTLLIWGDKDKETPLWMAKKMNKLIAHSTLILFKGGDHFAYYQECERFCFIVKEFLEEAL